MRLRVERIAPVHRPFIAVTNAAGEVVQIVDETDARILYRKAGCCTVAYCPRAAAADVLCAPHAAEVLCSVGLPASPVRPPL